jgi:hypothetical protein
VTSAARISVGRRAASGWPKSCIAAGRRCIEGAAQGRARRARARSPGRSTSVTWTASNRCQMNSGQQLSLGYRARVTRRASGTRGERARGNFFWMRKMPGVGDKWGCVPPRPFAPPACLTTRHKGAPSQHPAAAPGPKNGNSRSAKREKRAARARRRSCYFFSLPCAFPLFRGAR